MAHFAGLDVSVKETSVCVVDNAGTVLCERKVATEPEDIATLLGSVSGDYVRVGIEAGPLSQWLVSALAEAGLPMVCVETRHMKALLKAQQINKSDPNDARGIAQMIRVGLFKPVHVKTVAAQQHRMLLTSRKLVQRKLLDIECDLRGTLRNFGLKVAPVSPAAYDARIRDLVQNVPALAAIVEPLLSVCRVMRKQLVVLHKMVLDAVRHDPVCRWFLTVPGVAPLRALTYEGGARCLDVETMHERSAETWEVIALGVSDTAARAAINLAAKRPTFANNWGSGLSAHANILDIRVEDQLPQKAVIRSHDVVCEVC